MFNSENINQEKVTTAIHKVFPKATIGTGARFSNGLSSIVYKVEIQNPDKNLVIKFFPKKIEEKVVKSTKISNYAVENKLPSPRTYNVVRGEEEGWVVMDCLLGLRMI